MGFVIIDFKKRRDRETLQSLVPETVRNVDKFIKSYTPEEDLPPNESECAAIEEELMSTTLAEFDEVAGKLWRAKQDLPSRRSRLVIQLKRREGKLFSRFSDSVAELEDLAATMMEECMNRLEDTEEELKASLPTSTASIDSAFDELVKDCAEYIEENFPEGVEGIKAYDENLEPTFEALVEMIETKKNEEYPAANADAIPEKLEKVKERSKIMVQKSMNKAIKAQLLKIEKDMSEDDTLPYLDEEAMGDLKTELIEAAREYAESRIDEDFSSDDEYDCDDSEGEDVKGEVDE